MRRPAHSCAQFEAAATLVARRWTPLILRALRNGSLRYSDLADTVSQVSERMLVQRLKEMMAAGLVDRYVSPGVGATRVDYALTDKGAALAKVVGGLERWAEQWIPAK